MEKIDISTTLSEGLTESTMKAQAAAGELLAKLFKKYGVSAEEKEKLVAAIREYADGIYSDVYDMALDAGAELGDIRGYRQAMDEAEEAAEMLVTAMIKK